MFLANWIIWSKNFLKLITVLFCFFNCFDKLFVLVIWSKLGFIFLPLKGDIFQFTPPKIHTTFGGLLQKKSSHKDHLVQRYAISKLTAPNRRCTPIAIFHWKALNSREIVHQDYDSLKKIVSQHWMDKSVIFSKFCLLRNKSALKKCNTMSQCTVRCILLITPKISFFLL